MTREQILRINAAQEERHGAGGFQLKQERGEQLTLTYKDIELGRADSETLHKMIFELITLKDECDKAEWR